MSRGKFALIEIGGENTGMALTREKLTAAVEGAALLPLLWGVVAVLHAPAAGKAVGIVASGLYLMTKGVLGFGVSGA